MQDRNKEQKSSRPHGKKVVQLQSAKQKYLAKAKNALKEGDRVSAEHYFQHVDHYNRVLGQQLSPDLKSA